MRLPRRAHDAMLERIAAYWQSQLVFVAAKLGIADVLVEGPLTADEIAARVGAHAPYLKRVLRALASLGIFKVDPHGRFHLNRLAQTLRSDHPESLRDFALMLVDDYNWSAWGALEHAVRTGSSAFEHVHGAAAFPWMQEHPEKEKMFSASMASISVMENAAVARAYAFGKMQKIVDVGGAHGHLLATILRSYVRLRGVLFDQPQVIQEAARSGFIASPDVSARCETASGDFFESIPGGADAYLLKHILHDWSDEDCLRILKNIYAVTEPGTKLLMVDAVIGARNEHEFAKILDIQMLVLSHDGKERTQAEWKELLHAAGFQLTRVVPTPSFARVVEAVRINAN